MKPNALKHAIQVQSLQAVLQTQHPLMQVIMEMVDGVLICDANGHIQLVNSSLSHLLGLDSVTLGQPCQQVLPSADMALALQTVLENGEALSEEFSVKRTGRQKQTFQVHLMPLFARSADEDVAQPALSAVAHTKTNKVKTTISGAVAVLHDMTAIKKTEKMRRDFVANVSHELRTPLSAIKGYAETLLDGALEDDLVAHDFVNVIHNHAIRLSRLVEDLLDLSKLESPDFVPELTTVDLNALIVRVHSMVAGNVAGKDLRFNLHLHPGLPHVQANPDNMEQVLTNLLDNAVKYTPDGGDITVTSQAVAPKKGLPALVQITVKDTGIGIDAKHFPRLFERFYRVDKARSRDLGGTGLGLSIVKHIIQTHGGDIWVSSVPNQGSSFSFTLPIA
jgi:two-component system, OmpR family, phosphate regulon sensor histidine kinase PhoR